MKYEIEEREIVSMSGVLIKVNGWSRHHFFFFFNIDGRTLCRSSFMFGEDALFGEDKLVMPHGNFILA